jgi:6-pyruvoyltetrahydropterin/6-carboxytetrahydropterin synthase
MRARRYFLVAPMIPWRQRGRDFCIGDFEKVVNDRLIKVLDHKNLNVDVAEFAKIIPTVENIAAFAWNRLVGKFGGATLACVTVWETDKTRCSYYE